MGSSRMCFLKNIRNIQRHDLQEISAVFEDVFLKESLEPSKACFLKVQPSKAVSFKYFFKVANL